MINTGNIVKFINYNPILKYHQNLKTPSNPSSGPYITLGNMSETVRHSNVTTQSTDVKMCTPAKTKSNERENKWRTKMHKINKPKERGKNLWHGSCSRSCWRKTRLNWIAVDFISLNRGWSAGLHRIRLQRPKNHWRNLGPKRLSFFF